MFGQLLGAAFMDDAARTDLWRTWSPDPLIRPRGEVLRAVDRSVRDERRKAPKTKTRFLRVEGYTVEGLTLENLHDQRRWKPEFKAIINLRNAVYRHEVGGKSLKFKSLEDASDIGAFFILIWQGNQLVFAFKMASVFEVWTEGRWKLGSDTAQLQRGTTKKSLQKQGFYGLGAAIMCGAAGNAVTVTGARKFRKMAVMLSANLDKEAPKLLGFFEELGFVRQKVAELAPEGTLSEQELKDNVFLTTCGGLYDEPIALAPYVAPRFDTTRLTAAFCKYRNRLLGRHFAISLSERQLARTMEKCQRRAG